MDENENDELFENVPNFRESEESPTVEFDDEQQADFKICFSKFDPSGNETVQTEEVASLVRATGLNPTLKEFTKIEKWLQESNIENFTFNQFLKLLKGIWEKKDQVNDLEEAFKIIDKEDNGYISVEQLKEVLSGFGEKLDDDEFKELIKSIPVQTDGNINNIDVIQLFSTPIKPTN